MAKVKRATKQMDDAEWDYSRAVRGGPAKNPRAVVSVSLKTDEFRTIAQAAQAAGMTTSEFIRAAALRAALPQHHEPTVWPVQSWGFSMTFQIDSSVLIGARSSAEGPRAAFQPAA